MAYSDELIQRLMRLGGAGQRQQALAAQMAQAQALGRQQPERSTPLGALVGGLSNAGGALASSLLQAKLRGDMAGEERASENARADFLRAYGHSGQAGRQQEAAQSLSAFPVVPFAGPEYQQKQTEYRDNLAQEGAKQRQQRATDVALLSGDPILKQWAAAQRGGGDGRDRALDLTERRLEFDMEEAKRKAQAQKEEAAAQRGEREAKAAMDKDKRVADLEEGQRKELLSNTIVKDYFQSDNSFGSLQAAASKNTAAGDLAMIFGFMKTLDPTSVVKEGEQVQVQNTTNIPGQYLNMLDRAIKGTRLSPEQRQELLEVAASTLAAKKQRADGFIDGYRGLSARTGTNFANVMPISQGTTFRIPNDSPPQTSPGSQRTPAAQVLPKDASGQPTLGASSVPADVVKVRKPDGTVVPIKRSNLDKALKLGGVVVNGQ